MAKFVEYKILIHSETLLPFVLLGLCARARNIQNELKSSNRIGNRKSFRIPNTRVLPMLNSLFRNRHHSRRSLHRVPYVSLFVSYSVQYVCFPSTEIFFTFTCRQVSRSTFSTCFFNTVSAHISTINKTSRSPYLKRYFDGNSVHVLYK